MRISLISFLVLISFISCSEKQPDNISLTIADQYGLAYAPLQIMKDKGFLEDLVPGISVKWVKLGNTAAIREAVLAGRVDMGFLGIPPFLIGWDKGMPWKIFTGLSSAGLGLVSSDPEIRDLGDFDEDDRIALPQPGSIQHILLSMASERMLGKASVFDNQLVTMNHPDGMNALLSGGSITAHFTSPPYVRMELADPGMHLVLTGNDAMGENFTFIAGMVTDAFGGAHSDVVSAVRTALEKSSQFISGNPAEAAEILYSGYSLSKEEVLEYLTDGSLSFSGDLTGVDEFSDFMFRNGYISKSPGRNSEIIFGTDRE